jgi:hypothetical protein
VKRREGKRVVEVSIRYAHGSMRCVQQVLEQLGYTTPNTSAIERRNATARRMNAHLVRRSLAFSRRDDTKVALGWWGLTVYNCLRPHRSLRLPLNPPQGKKIRATHPGNDTRSYRPSLVRSRTLAHAPVPVKGCEIISCHHQLAAWIAPLKIHLAFPRTRR